MPIDLTLVFPPHWGFDVPHLSLPTLAASARRAGFSVAVRDLNIELCERLLSRQVLRGSAARIERQLARLRPAADGPRIAALEECLATAELVGRDLDRARALLLASCDPAEVHFASNVAERCLRVVSAAHEPVRLSLRDFTTGGRHFVDLDGALREAGRADSNPYFDLMDRPLVESLLAADPRAIGLSVTSSTQLLPALTLAGRLRQAAPGVPIIAGGALLAHMAGVLPHAVDLFDWFDYLVLGEGESLLNGLLADLRAGRRPADAPGLVHRGSSLGPCLGRPEAIDDLPAPDYSDLRLERYCAGGGVVPLLASRGCAWGRCAFCGLNASYHSCYRERAAPAVAADVLQVTAATGARHVSFNDESMSPGRVEALARALAERGVEVEWDVLARVDRRFTGAGLAEARRAGLRFVKWGFESGSPRVLRRMAKGISPEGSRQAIRAGAAAGIWNHLFVLLGFPGERREDFEQTRDFLLAEQEFIDSLSIATFSCDRGSPVFERPERFGVRIAPVSNRYVGPEHDYEVTEGVSRRQAADWARELDAALSVNSHLGAIHTRGLGNTVLYKLVDRLGRDRVRRGLLARAQAVRGTLAAPPAELLGLPAIDLTGLDVRPLGPGALVSRPATGELMAVNETGLRILAALRAGGSPGAAAAAVAADCDVPRARVEPDCAEFVRGLLLLGADARVAAPAA